MMQLLPHTYTEGYDYTNSLLYTNRLRLQMNAKVANNVEFVGRLAMYKVFGDSTGVQVFNGQPGSINRRCTASTARAGSWELGSSRRSQSLTRSR